MKSNKKPKIYPVVEEKIFNSPQVESSYAISEEERAFNFSIRQRPIMALKTLDDAIKTVLIDNNILTVADLQISSLDFLLDRENSEFQKMFAVFQECKRFLNSIDFSRGLKYSDY